MNPKIYCMNCKKRLNIKILGIININPAIEFTKYFDNGYNAFVCVDCTNKRFKELNKE